MMSKTSPKILPGYQGQPERLSRGLGRITDSARVMPVRGSRQGLKWPQGGTQGGAQVGTAEIGRAAVSALFASVLAGMALATASHFKIRKSGGRSAGMGMVLPVLPLIIDLKNPSATLDALESGARYRKVLCLLTRDGDPVSKLSFQLAEHETVTPAVVRQHLAARAWPEAAGADRSTSSNPNVYPSVTVVLATRNRPEQLVECLASIESGTLRAERIVVVDNAPSDERTAELMALRTRQDPRLVYVREDRPGLAHAHNAAMPHIATDVVAFTDDDVLADRRWLERLVKVFAEDPSAVCVTGMIAPRELDTLPQQWVEGNMTYDKGLHRRVFDGTRGNAEFPLMPYTSGACGSGANMAFQTRYLQNAGGFEAALGTGTVAMGGDDLAAFHDVLASGNRLVYEPAAIVLHPHHRDYAALRRQVYGYGAGLGAHLMRCLMHDPRMVLAFAGNVSILRSRATNIMNPPVVAGLPPYPRDLLREHRRGLLSGPWRYLRSRRHLKRQIAAGGTP